MRVCTGLFLMLGLTASGSLLGGAEPAKSPSPAQVLAELKQEHQRASDELDKAFKEAQTDSERTRAFEPYRRSNEKIIARAVELARKNPKDPVSLEALTWVITGGLGFVGETETAFDLIARDHLASDKLEMVCAMAGLDNEQKAAERFLRTVLQKSPHPKMRGIACLSLARNLKYQAAVAHYQKKPDADRLARECESMYERAAAEYGEVKFRDRTVGERAKAALFEMRNLVIGKKAPDIQGEDIDGKKFKLSDYQGKVVLLDFWGNW